MGQVLKDWASLVRLKNLLIVALVIGLLYGLALPYSAHLQGFNLFVFILGMAFLTAGGNLINDLYDLPIDAINKPERPLPSGRITPKQAWWGYAIVNVLALITAVYTAIVVSKTHLLLIYPIPIILLALYATRFKKQGLVGNLLIALFCAGVPLLVSYIEYGDLTTNAQLLNYSVFAFISTLVREIIKDCEDMEGDGQNHCQTLPLRLGLKTTQQALILLQGLLLCQTAAYTYFFSPNPISIFLNLVFQAFLLKQLTNTNNYTKLSTLSKIQMLLGLGMLK
jgi:4-hydroxybenzoate polyprenyltransferase